MLNPMRPMWASFLDEELSYFHFQCVQLDLNDQEMYFFSRFVGISIFGNVLSIKI